MNVNLLLIGLGGALGSMARWLLQKTAYNYYPHAFPLGTFCINITGCFLIGIFWTMANKSHTLNEGWQSFLMAGLCGGFTTFSAFTLESITLIKENKIGLFLAYVSTSLILGLLATVAGMFISR